MPEEQNRILTDRLSSVLYCPTQPAIDNLNREGVNHWGAKVLLSGDVMQDGAIYYKPLSKPLPDLKIKGEFILSTIHRAENTDDSERMTNIVNALNEISKVNQVVLPLHPRTREKLTGLDVSLSPDVSVIEPVGYLNMVWLIDNCKLVMTDSGGLQKEAFFFSKPCITLRDETEWVELVDNNFNILVGSNQERIVHAYKSHTFSTNFDLDLYGLGLASNKIVKNLIDHE